ncbi:MAG: UBP-type zinc finger domain-containing protein [Actinomycetota bacterium]
MEEICTHLRDLHEVEPTTPDGCAECLEMGERWVHLRLCMSCGHVGCCDTSKNKHATKHFHATQHPVIQSFQPDEDWLYCFVDDLTVEPA